MYNNNPQLRAANEEIRMSKKRLQEYIRCKEDILYFAENYFKITTIDDGKITIPLRRYQKKMLKAFHQPTKDRKHVVCTASRQSGKCVCSDTNIKIKNKKTGEIEKIQIGDFFDMVNT